MDFLSNLGLGLSFKEAQVDDMAFPSGQPVHGLTKGDFFHPVFLGAFLIFDLVHHIEGITAVCVDWLIKTHRALDGIQRVGDIFLADANFLGNFHESWLSGIFPCQTFPCIDGFVGSITQGTADSDGIVIPQIPPDLTQNHGNRIG